MDVSMEELAVQWKLVENECDARKLLEKLNAVELTIEEPLLADRTAQNVLKVKSLVRSGELRKSYELQAKFDALFPVKDDASLHVFHQTLALFHLFVDKNLEKARDNIRKVPPLNCSKSVHFFQNLSFPAIAFAETDTEDTLISAQILIARGQRQLANTQLVHAAKEASDDWRVFYWLSENLTATGMLEKAKLCVERARQLNGASELCAKLLQEILQKTNSADAIRLNALHNFLSHRPTSLWALRQAAILEINLGKLDHAIDKCQRAIRLMSNAFGECFENTNHRQQICAMWAFISEAYRQKGNLQSAVRACRAIVELDATNYTAKLQLIQLHQGMCHYLDAIALGETIERELPDSFDPNAENDGVDGMMPRPLITHFRTLHLLSLVLYISDSEEMRRCHFVKIQLEKLPDIFSRAKVLLDEGENSSSILLHRCLAQAFKIVQSFNQPTLRDCLQSSGLCKTSAEGGWGICSRSELAKCRIRFLMTVLRANRRASDSWNELGLAFLDTHLLIVGKTDAPKMAGEGKNSFLKRALLCIQTAIRFSGSNLKKSEYICNLGRIYIVEGNAFRAQHCFIRAVQLNRHCATAWALLSLLYLQLGLNDEALKAMDNAQKISPSMSEAWCSHAIHAELTNHFDTMDLYRHAIVLKPSAFAIQKYCRFLVDFQRRRKCLDEGSMINFDVLKNVFYTCRLDAQFVHALACLAEHFWYLEEAREYICEPKSLEKAPKDDVILARNRERILIKSGESLLTAEQLEHKFPGSGLGKLKALYDEPTPALYERLQKLSPLNELITSLCAGDLSNFCHHYNPKLFPLLATIAIVFGLPIPSAVFSVIESVRPLHRLFDVFPTVFAGYQIDRPQLAPHDEEEMVVRQDHLTENLYALLKQKLDEERTDEKEGEKNCN